MHFGVGRFGQDARHRVLRHGAKGRDLNPSRLSILHRACDTLAEEGDVVPQRATTHRLALAVAEQLNHRPAHFAHPSPALPMRPIDHNPSSRPRPFLLPAVAARSEEHTSELQSLMRISYAVLSLK